MFLCSVIETHFMSINPRKMDPSLVVVPEVSFSVWGHFKSFFPRFKGLRAEGVTFVHICTAHWEDF